MPALDRRLGVFLFAAAAAFAQGEGLKLKLIADHEGPVEVVVKDLAQMSHLRTKKLRPGQVITLKAHTCYQFRFCRATAGNLPLQRATFLLRQIHGDRKSYCEFQYVARLGHYPALPLERVSDPETLYRAATCFQDHGIVVDWLLEVTPGRAPWSGQAKAEAPAQSGLEDLDGGDGDR